VTAREPGEFFEQLSALARMLRGVATESYAEFDVGGTQARMLRHIGRHARISQADLARATGSDPALTGRVLDALVERGWVRRTRSELDRRQYVLELTPAGQRIRKRVEEVRARVAERIARVLDERDHQDFERIAAKIHAAFEA
jgi:DNA-binding MarR family transcriptional regulator